MELKTLLFATCQMAFRHHHGDRYAGASSFIFGSSIRNCVSSMYMGVLASLVPRP